MWRKGLCVIFYIVLQHVQSVKICSGDNSGIQRIVDVEMENVSGPCTCDIRLTVNYFPSIILNFRNTQSNDILCSNIKLVFENNQILDKTWCGNDSDFSIPIDALESSNVSLIVDGIRNSFKFSISTAKPGNMVQIGCYGSPPTPTQTTTSTTTSLPSRRSSASLPSITTISNQFNTDQVTITTSTKTTQITTAQLTRDNNDSDDDVSNLAIILGCSIGGTVVIIIIIAGCILLRRRNRQKKMNTEIANHGSTNMAVYCSLDDDLKVSGQYEQITRHQPEQHVLAQQEHGLMQLGHVPQQQERGPEQIEHSLGQQEHVPNRSNEYVNVTKESKGVLIGENGIELNDNMNACISKVNNNYENVKERKNII